MKDKPKSVKMEKLYLQSVNCVMVCASEPEEYTEPIIHPAKPDNTIDMSKKCKLLSDCTSEWFSQISAEDKLLVWNTFKIEIDPI